MSYKLLKIEVSKAKNKKYASILVDKNTGKKRTVNWGDKRYQHYYDKLGKYSNLNHNDKKRRDNFKSRFGNRSKIKYSASYFANKYLW